MSNLLNMAKVQQKDLNNRLLHSTRLRLTSVMMSTSMKKMGSVPSTWEIDPKLTILGRAWSSIERIAARSANRERAALSMLTSILPCRTSSFGANSSIGLCRRVGGSTGPIRKNSHALMTWSKVFGVWVSTRWSSGTIGMSPSFVSSTPHLRLT